MNKESLPATTLKDDKSKAHAIKETLEVGGKILIGLAGLCYVLGLIVVTIHLRGYGLNSLSLSQLHYVTAGVWVMIPVLMGMCVVIFLQFLWKEVVKDKIVGGVVVIFTVFFMVYVGASALGRYFGIQATVFSRHGVVSWVVAPALGTIAFAPIGALIYMWMSHTLRKDSAEDNQNQPDTPYRREQFMAVAVFAVAGMFLSVVYLGLFAGHTYKDIPWATGGGGHSKVQLMIDPKEREYLEGVGLKLSATGSRTESIRLLMVTEKEFILLDPDGNAVSIPADSVKAVLYER